MQTKELTPGTTVHVPASLNGSAFTGTVEGVEPWILKAGPQAGQQARKGRGKNAPLLWTVRITDVTRTAPPQHPVAADSVDATVDADSERHMAVTADHEWTV